MTSGVVIKGEKWLSDVFIPGELRLPGDEYIWKSNGLQKNLAGAQIHKVIKTPGIHHGEYF